MMFQNMRRILSVEQNLVYSGFKAVTELNQICTFAIISKHMGETKPII